MAAGLSCILKVVLCKSCVHESMCNLQMPPKGVLAPYDPENYDESFASEYGGYTFSEGAGGGGGGRGGGRGGPRFVGSLTTLAASG